LFIMVHDAGFSGPYSSLSWNADLGTNYQPRDDFE
jgi:hypothetical protein